MSCMSTILLRAYEAAIRAPDKVAQQAFNVGGGPDQILSLLDLIDMLERRLGRAIPCDGTIGVPAISRSTSATFASSIRYWAGNPKSPSRPELRS